MVFMGSPTFAQTILEALLDHYDVVGVVTQPDKPAGRGRHLQPPAVKGLALKAGVPVIQPARLHDPEAMDQLRAWAPDLIVVAAYGQILRPEVLSLPRYGCLNVHASLLPRWRGASPIQYAILHGDQVTGVTIMIMDEGLDTGPILSQRETAIGPEETAGELTTRLARLGADLLVETIPRYLSGDLQPRPQDDSRATLAPRLTKEQGRLDWQKPADVLARQVRAFEPWPGSYLDLNGKRVLVRRAHAHHQEGFPPPGTVVEVDGQPAVTTPDGLLVLDVVQPAGKRAMPGEAFLRGARHLVGQRVSRPPEQA